MLFEYEFNPKKFQYSKGWKQIDTQIDIDVIAKQIIQNISENRRFYTKY